MLYSADERIKKGVQICVQSVQLVYQHPILLVYALLQGALAVLAGVGTYYNAHPEDMLVIQIIISLFVIIISLFVDFCLARHTMHILRQQISGIHESFQWVFRHIKQIAVWIFISIFLNMSDVTLVLIPVVILTTMGSILSGSVFSKVFLLVLAIMITLVYFILISLVSGIVIPILATEKISVLTAFKRSLHVVWKNLLTYCVMMFIQAVIILIVFLVCAVVLSLFASVTGSAYGKGIAMLLTIFVTISKTIFYYMFYVQPSLELAEISMTQQM